MDYKEWYVIEYKSWTPLQGDLPGELGPFDTEEDAMQAMKKIQKQHDHVKHIYWAHMYRMQKVMLAGYARARKES